MKRIVLDPGHGGSDPGALGPTGLREKDVTLAVAKYLQQELQPLGSIYMTRDKDEYKSLRERVDLANNLKADYFISIHCNATTNRAAKGTETLIYAFGKEAEKLARKVQTRLVKVLGTQDRGVKVRPGLYVLAHTAMPAILVETAFISNPEEERLLADPAQQQSIARAIVEGIADHLGMHLRPVQTKEADEEVERAKVIYEGKALEAFIKDGKTYVEVKKLCEMLGLKVMWNSSTKTVEVKR
ncbi:MAG: N-acetylmuramoyl-L-alanine amidase [Thermoanaerobacter sp.]|nr:N-acetylmuramoyl-L-alanine amidase [Thermoanaerobacter sp.]